MNTVKFSRCFKCKKNLSCAALEREAISDRLVCVDKSACNYRVAKSKECDVVEKDNRLRDDGST